MGMLYEYSQEDQDRIKGIPPSRYEVRDALAGVIGLIQLMNGNDQIPETVRHAMLTNHRFLEAQRILGRLERS